MLPKSNEFIALYILLFIVIAYYLYIFPRRGIKLRIITSIVFLITTVLLSFIFYNPENFKYGGSLAVLFYSYLLAVTNLAFVLIINFYINKSKK